MKIFLIAFLLLQVFAAKSQKDTIRLSCPDSLGFITNLGFSKACEFSLEHANRGIFYVENFSHNDFGDVFYKNDYRKIQRAKLVMKNYMAHVHDFVFSYNKDNGLVFYYILKDTAEEQILQL